MNILVNQSGHACLADFGLSTVVGFGTHLDHLDADFSSANQRDSLMSFIEGGTYPWMSPELLGMDVGNGRPTKESDIYALGMVIYEVSGCSICSHRDDGPTDVNWFGIGFMWDNPVWRSCEIDCDRCGNHERNSPWETGRCGQSWVYG